jgi:hypothetical protein
MGVSKGLQNSHKQYGVDISFFTISTRECVLINAQRRYLSGWSDCRVGLAPTGKRHLFTAHPIAAVRYFARVPVMSNSLQTLSVVGRLFPMILSGEKTSTIRWREARIAPGPMRYVCDDNVGQSTVVHVLKCTDMPLASVATYLGKTEEWPDDVMLAGMREHYPEIELTDIVQVVEHKPFKPDV